MQTNDAPRRSVAGLPPSDRPAAICVREFLAIKLDG